MKVLMLGWEYPPHITGGLGTACRGLTRGLAAAGSEILFVVPRAFGDERADWMEFEAAGQGGVETLELEAELAPYRPIELGAPSPAVRARAALLPGWERASLPASAAQWRALAEGVAAAARAGRGSDSIPHEPPRPESAAFRGGYGPGLFGEVARYAACVATRAGAVQADLVHAHDWMTFPAGLAAARVLGVPFVAHVHSTEYDRAGACPDERVLAIERMGLEAADRVVTVSTYEARRLGELFDVEPGRLAVVHNSVERRPRPTVRSRIGVGSPPTVLFLGRVTEQKGPELLLDAARIVLARRPEVRFVIAGDGDLLPRTVLRGATEGLAERVLYTGFLGPDDVQRAFERADLFVLPSVSEPFGIAPLEAVEAGLPVIVSRASGVSEVLPSAPRFEPGDAPGLARAILDVLDSEVWRAELIADARADLERSSWESSGARLAAIHAEVASR